MQRPDSTHWSAHPLASMTRRELLGKSSLGLGLGALATLLCKEKARGSNESIGGLPGLPHKAPKAKRIIYLFQNGGPTHVDLFDYKPKLKELHGKPVPESFIEGKRFSTMSGTIRCG